MGLFQPLRWLSNPHVQTILANFLSGDAGGFRVRKIVLPLPDGDRILLDETVSRRSSPEQPMALMIHGLGGCTDSGYMQRIASRLCQKGWRVFRMNLRAAGDGIRLARRFYHAACSGDVRAIAEQLAQTYPQAPLAVLGFSLGGNIVLKYAGELAGQPPSALRAVVAMAPPIDLVRSSEMVARQPLYDAFYVHHLTKQVRQHQRYFPDLPRIVFPRRLTLRGFDTLYTVPRWGYADLMDYYRRATVVSHISLLRVPTFILTARDDPFVAVESFETLQAPSRVEVHITEHGGHLGFLGRDEAGGIHWGETQIVNWLIRQI